MDKGYENLAASIGPTMKPFTSTILIIFHPLKDSMLIRTFRMFWLPLPFKVGSCEQSCVLIARIWINLSSKLKCQQRGLN